MAGLQASRAQRVPLFAGVGATLKREIAAGRFAQSDLLPGERELSQMLDVSRTTLRRAIAGLVDEGVLVHRHGAGTFVRRNPPHVEQPLSRLTSFTEDMRLRGFAASSRAIERGTFLPTPEESIMLDISSDANTCSASRDCASPTACRWRSSARSVPLRFLRRRRARRRLALRRARNRGAPSGPCVAAAARRRARRRGGGAARRPRRLGGARHSSHRLLSPTDAASSTRAPSIARTPTTSSPN